MAISGLSVECCKAFFNAGLLFTGDRRRLQYIISHGGPMKLFAPFSLLIHHWIHTGPLYSGNRPEYCHCIGRSFRMRIDRLLPKSATPRRLNSEVSIGIRHIRSISGMFKARNCERGPFICTYAVASIFQSCTLLPQLSSSWPYMV